ncbi:MAG: GxxExxY protein [Methanosarcinales archaeon]|nr:GxxExxY protein [Methanosarcinales archaeon]
MIILLKKTIGAAYNVHNTLGPGFIEKVYLNSLTIELQSFGFIIGVEKLIKEIKIFKSIQINNKSV